MTDLDNLDTTRAASLKMLADSGVSLPMLETDILAVESKIHAGEAVWDDRLAETLLAALTE